jgi:hypothetical protein
MSLKAAVTVLWMVALLGLLLTAAIAQGLEGDSPKPRDGAREALERLFSEESAERGTPLYHPEDI